MVSPTLIHVPKTISSPIVQCLVELNLVDNPVKVQEVPFPELKTEAILSYNPMGSSPTFHDGDIIIWESGAVLDYLLERYDTEHQLHPPSITKTSTNEQIAARGKYMQLKQYIIATVYPFMASMFIHTLLPKEKQDSVYLANAEDKWTNLLGPVLTKWLGKGPYFLGDQITAVDFLVLKPVNNGMCHKFAIPSLSYKFSVASEAIDSTVARRHSNFQISLLTLALFLILASQFLGIVGRLSRDQDVF
jgi:glutathione S-transferase